jgi:hypothetical protein
MDGALWSKSTSLRPSLGDIASISFLQLHAVGRALQSGQFLLVASDRFEQLYGARLAQSPSCEVVSDNTN